MELLPLPENEGCVSLLFPRLHPSYRRVENGVASRQEGLAVGHDLLIRPDAVAFEPFAAGGNIVGEGILKPSPLGKRSNCEGRAAPGVGVPKMQARPRSLSPPA